MKMKIIKEKAKYGRLPISLSTYVIEQERDIYETNLKSNYYKGFEVEFVEHLNLDKSHLRFVIKKINGNKVNVHISEVRKYIHNLINRVFKKINGNKESVENDRLFNNAIKKTDFNDTIDSLLINARYNGKQFNWCFEYLYNKGMSVAELAVFL